MMKIFLFAFALLTGNVSRADLAVSIRYFKSEGVSHYHLFLYRDDGTLLRQLTSPEKDHDVSPRFVRNGKEVEFTRLVGRSGRQIWRIGVDGKGLRKIANEAPATAPQKLKCYIINVEENAKKPAWEAVADGYQLAIPESKDVLLLPKADVSTFGHPESLPETRAFQALTVQGEDGKKTRIPTDHGVHDSFCNWLTHDGSPFLKAEGLHVAFYEQHMGSTDGFRVSALDLLGKREVVLTESNPAMPVAHGTRAGFFSVCQERYQPLPGTQKTVNCLYLDWWNNEFKRTRFARALSLLGGASVRVKGQPQLDIPLDADR